MRRRGPQGRGAASKAYAFATTCGGDGSALLRLTRFLAHPAVPLALLVGELLEAEGHELEEEAQGGEQAADREEEHGEEEEAEAAADYEEDREDEEHEAGEGDGGGDEGRGQAPRALPLLRQRAHAPRDGPRAPKPDGGGAAHEAYK